MNESYRTRDDRRRDRVVAADAGESSRPRESAAPTRGRKARWLIAIAIFLTVAGFVAVTANDLGVTWDEPAYHYSQLRMAQWFHSLATCTSLEQVAPLLSKAGILSGWEYNRFGSNFHPPLAGILCNLTHLAFGAWMGDLPARRLASGIELALAAAALFMFLSRRYTPWVGIVAAASLVFMPRVFGDAHVAGTDIPLMAFWSFTALAFWNGLDSAVWRVAFGVLLGLSLLVKFSAVLIVAPLFLWLLCYRIIPQWSAGRAVAVVAATALVGWPLMVAGIAIVRLSEGIRIHTQLERMLGPGMESIAGQTLESTLQHLPPYSPEELTNAVQSLNGQSAEASLHGMIRRELADAISHRQEPTLADIAAVRPILREARQDVLLRYFQHGPPYQEAELKRAALQMLEEIATRRGTSVAERIGHAAPFSAGELKHVSRALSADLFALDQCVGYVKPIEDLGVTTRIPGWILFVPLVMWGLWNTACVLRIVPARFRACDGGAGLWLAGLGIAPAVAIAFNPTWWHETLPQLAHFYQISADRQGSLPDIEIFYLGKKYIYSLPWHNAWVLMGVTIPAAILVGGLVGLCTSFWNIRRDPLRMFFVLQMITLPVSRMLPTPAHDGVRLMLPAFFFFAGLVGWGFEWIDQIVERFRSEEYSTTPVLTVAAAFLLGPPAYWLVRTHPHELSYYNGFVGGLNGAQRLGFEPTYWYDAMTPEVLNRINDPERGMPAGAMLSLPEPQSILSATLPGDARLANLLRNLPERRINPDDLFSELSLTHKLRKDIRVQSLPGVPPEVRTFPYVALLTHSSKASPFTRLLYAFKPYGSWDFDGVRLFSLYDPRAVARAWALWLLVDATDYSRAKIEPRVDHELIELARRDYRALYAAALRVTEVGLDKAAADEDDPDSLAVIRRLVARRELMDLLMARRPEALIEAVETLSRAAEKRPSLLEQLVESYDGYLPASQLGSYLDE
jgi:hypothetical protein